MTNYISRFLTLILFIILLSCQEDNSGQVEKLILDIKSEYAPDKRVAVWEIEWSNGILSGETDQMEALQILKGKLDGLNIQFDDQVKILPDLSLEGKTFAVVTISVANIRSAAKHSAELATQALLGTPLKVLKKESSWYLVQTPDQYISWVDSGGIQVMDEQELSDWNQLPKAVFTDYSGFAYADRDEKEIISDLVAGNIISLEWTESNHQEILLPDGRVGFVKNDQLMPFEAWNESRKLNSENLIQTAKAMMGVPYLWGGTSIKGVDCSGFTKTIYFLNGQVIPRDASQQIWEGEEVDEDKSWENLEVGDLLFFGEKATGNKKERVVHVGMWIGDNSFIHSRGRVRISSFDQESPDYDEYELNRYLRTKRVIGKITPNIKEVESMMNFPILNP
ncbi:NlpC/P60 family protein [Aquiflexum sp.]|uniref:C40 family peptidase n=1 Tax=Aquiflexum sp. TaxID=1872584 RepID=UPI003592F309